jgi:hypothetical protein
MVICILCRGVLCHDTFIEEYFCTYVTQAEIQNVLQTIALGSRGNYLHPVALGEDCRDNHDQMSPPAPSRRLVSENILSLSLKVTECRFSRFDIRCTGYNDFAICKD